MKRLLSILAVLGAVGSLIHGADPLFVSPDVPTTTASGAGLLPHQIFRYTAAGPLWTLELSVPGFPPPNVEALHKLDEPGDWLISNPESSTDLVGGKKSARDVGLIFKLFDTNRDQRVDRAEFRIGIVSAFEMYDTDHDNSLSQAELPSVKSSEFDKADHSNDGRLSVLEFVISDFMKFTRFDRNRDGFVTYER